MPDESYEVSITSLVESYCHWYNTNVKERQHDLSDISMMFANSRLGNNIVKKINGTSHMLGRRVLGPEEQKNDDEIFMIGVDNNHNDDDDGEIDDEVITSEQALINTYNEYMSLVDDNNISPW